MKIDYLKSIQETQIEIDALIKELDEVERLRSEVETAEYIEQKVSKGWELTQSAICL